MDHETGVEDTSVEELLALLEPVGGWLNASPLAMMIVVIDVEPLDAQPE